MSEVRIIPHEGPRVETGAVQFGDDWRGIFIRGDNAGWIAHCIGVIGQEIDKLSDDAQFLWHNVDEIRRIIQGEVVSHASQQNRTHPG